MQNTIKNRAIEIISKSFGVAATNCYIVRLNEGDIIIDAGVGAADWVVENVKNPLAILNTHGHFDHVWSNSELQKRLEILLYTPKADVFMLKNDVFGYGMETSIPDVEVNGNEKFSINGADVEFLHFPGHSPGTSAILIEKVLFTGDFVFKNSIGRTDFPYSSNNDMKKSILKFLNIKEDMKIYPGHGASTSVKAEQKTLSLWLEYL